ncbi:MAG: beta-N-acetylhexosaminidase [Clostridia bacterium]|nr:beta-N-acetylhexosaminidase [Clostridia bacterium]
MQTLLQGIREEIGFVFPENTVYQQREKGLSLTLENGKYTVGYSSAADIARAALLAKRNNGIAEYRLQEQSDYDDLCFMVDCSRNAVHNLPTVKKLIRNIAMLGFNSIMLYTEDTYQIKDEPVFGYLRGGYTIEEMKEIDAYACSFGIEVIPCIQTLAHLRGLKRWYADYQGIFDCEDILMVGEERVYALIENMFKTLSECFSSRRIHIGMDEAHMVGRGAYMDKHGCRNRFDILSEHLQVISKLLDKYGYQAGIMWSDMFWKIAKETKECVDKQGRVCIPPSVLERLPNNVQVCHWNYASKWSAAYEDYFRMHKGFKTPVWFAEAAHKCTGYMPATYSNNNAVELAVRMTKKYDMKSIIYCAWADDGAECSLFSVLPNMAYMGNKARGKNKGDAKKDFYALTGYSFDQFMKVGYADSCCGKVADGCSPTKLALYNDLFLGQMDFNVIPEYLEYFKKARTVARRMTKGQYGYIFRTIADLCDVVIIKYDMGIRLRTAYQAGDKQTLAEIADEMTKLQRKLRAFIVSLRAQWLTTNKPHGFEILEFRIGGLIERTKACQQRLRQYVKGEIDAIPELAEKLLGEVLEGRNPRTGRFGYNSFMLTASVNSFGKSS